MLLWQFNIFLQLWFEVFNTKLHFSKFLMPLKMLTLVANQLNHEIYFWIIDDLVYAPELVM